MRFCVKHNQPDTVFQPCVGCAEAATKAVDAAYAAGLIRAAEFMEADKGQKETHPSHAGITHCLDYYPKMFRRFAEEEKYEEKS